MENGCFEAEPHVRKRFKTVYVADRQSAKLIDSFCLKIKKTDIRRTVHHAKVEILSLAVKTKKQTLEHSILINVGQQGRPSITQQTAQRIKIQLTNAPSRLDNFKWSLI
jgi:hypothetical protein